VAHTVGRILAAVRRLDDATTLRGILDALADAAGAEALRVAVLLVDRGQLRVYRQHGFAAGEVPGGMPVTVSAPVSEAVFRCSVVPVGETRLGAAGRPSFPRVQAGRSGLILPLVVDQSAVALVFVDGAADTPDWSDAVEVLVRHGSARLESVTSQRTVEALTASS
jgi:hypothetical protein